MTPPVGGGGAPADNGEPSGAQNERTALAWGRTALSVVVTAAIVSRFSIESIGPVALLALVGAVPVSTWLVYASRRRYSRRLDWTQRPPLQVRDGRFEFAVSAVTVLMIVVVAAAVVF